MTERIVEDALEELPEIDEMLEKVLVFALEEAKDKLLAEDEEVVPFTCLVVGENLFMESHPGEEAEECFNAARHTVQGARGADAYAFCYDGFIDTDDGDKDALIAEGGLVGQHDAFAVAYLYEENNGAIKVTDEPVYVGPAPNFMEFLTKEDASEFDESAYADGNDEESDVAGNEEESAN